MQVDRIAFLQPAQQLLIPFDSTPGSVPLQDDFALRAPATLDLLVNRLGRQNVALGITRAPVEGAEATLHPADVRS